MYHVSRNLCIFALGRNFPKRKTFFLMTHKKFSKTENFYYEK